MESIHGGDIYRNHVILDFSVNMNPMGIPESIRQALFSAVGDCGAYPDIEAEKLSAAVGEMTGVPREWLLFGNGASELFMAIVHGLRPSRTVIPVPSFYGYEHAAGAVSGEVVYVSLEEKDRFLPREEMLLNLTEDTDLLFLANPNNPTGQLIGKTELKKILDRCLKKQITVVLDECFVEFTGEENSMLSELSVYENLIVVRAFTKIFSIPGVRLGYLACKNRDLRERIRRQLPEWNLSTFAQAAGLACAGETGFVKETVSYVKAEREYLATGLARVLGTKVKLFPGAANFILLQTGLPLGKKLLERGILIRDCKNFRGLTGGYYRIAVKSRPDNEKLLITIGEITWNESNM